MAGFSMHQDQWYHGLMPSLHKARTQYFKPLTRESIEQARAEWIRLPKTRFLTDANMEPWALHVMRYKHFDVRVCNLEQSADDRAVYATAWRLGRFLITHDTDFLDDRLFPFATCCGLLVLPTYGRISMQFANLLAGACELVSRGARLWFHTKVIARRDFTLKVRTWEKSHGHIAEWTQQIPIGYRKAASDAS